MKSAYKIIVKGLVQGVAFRYYTKLKAEELHIKGWVRNQSDKSVLIEAAGIENNIEAFLKWCHKGSPAAKVSEINYHEIDYFEAANFEIIR